MKLLGSLSGAMTASPILVARHHRGGQAEHRLPLDRRAAALAADGNTQAFGISSQDLLPPHPLHDRGRNAGGAGIQQETNKMSGITDHFDCRTFRSPAGFWKLAKVTLCRVDEPEMLNDRHYVYEAISVLEEIVEEVGDDGSAKDRMVYVLANDDYSWPRLGQGQSDRPQCNARF
jgi:hypothetical protein